MISAFGPRAEAFAVGLGDVDAVVADVSGLGKAYIEAMVRRETGRPFYSMVLYEDPRAAATLGYAAAVLDQAGGDLQRAALEELGAGRLGIGTQRVDSLWNPPDAVKQTVNEILSLGDGVLVRSFAEAARLDALAARPYSVDIALAEPDLPDVRPRRDSRGGIVVWAPLAVAPYLAWYAFALAEFTGDVTCVVSSGTLPAGLPARVVTRRDPQLAEILAAAHCIVCADPDDPGAAVAFARRGFGVAAPLASGAHELVRNVASFAFNTPSEVEAAVTAALAKPASVRATPRPLPAPVLPALPVPVAELPLVSIMVATYNRPDDLERCLTDLSRQTYPNLEIVVNNDAGENVDHIVARFPRARIINQPKNLGMLLTIIEEFKNARGEYIQMLADDDTLYPDHVERLMSAMLRSGARVAHANTVIRYQDRGADGQLSLRGFNAIVFRDSAIASEALIASPVAGQSIIIKRDILDEIGPFSTETELPDQEFQLRAANAYVFVWVDAFTSEWRVRGAGENFASRTDSAHELRKLFEVLHPLPERPVITELRNRTLDDLDARPKGYIFEPTIVFRNST